MMFPWVRALESPPEGITIEEYGYTAVHVVNHVLKSDSLLPQLPAFLVCRALNGEFRSLQITAQLENNMVENP